MEALRQHAVVIGGSMTGMLTAQVLTHHYAKVTIIERDQLPDEAEIRDGAPQARHLHVLLAKGLEIVEKLLPGIEAEMVAHGATTQFWGRDTTMYMERGWMPSFESEMKTHGISRVLLEWLVRKRIRANTKITIMERTVVKQLLTNDSRQQVTGVEIQPKGTMTTSTIHADLVIDASGRGSNAAEWLTSFGYEQVTETVVNSFLGYATRRYKRPANFPAHLKMITIQSLPPVHLSGGVIMEVENGECLVTVAGVNKNYPPTDEAGFVEFVRTLLSPVIYDLIRDAEPLSKVYGYQRTENRIRHYERFTRWPDGFIVLGDAACAFNPIYGQGMTTGAMEADDLGKLLDEYKGRDQTGMAKAFQKRLAKLIETPWLMATSEDLRYPATEGAAPNWRIRLVQQYIQRIIAIMPDHPEAADVFLHVMNLVQPPTQLFRPSLLVKVLGSLLTKKKTAQNHTAIPAALSQPHTSSSLRR
ncbi:MAG: FAD-dependent monooxygenase [Chloroflexi bacterium]|nr:FAD-dependent monooxygenase [Chloroflexota bacterium]MCC6891792.1 FAD-dependent monooxygenase [Anaerolineae bacterium]